MVWTSIISTVIVAIGGFGVWPSMAGMSAPPQTELSFGSNQLRPTAWQLDLWEEHSLGSHRYFVQRESSKPPGESRTGRASSGPAGGVIDSKRDSSQPSDATEDRSKQSIVSETEKDLGEPEVDPKKSRDPTEGGGETPSSFNRRGGVR